MNGNKFATGEILRKPVEGADLSSAATAHLKKNPPGQCHFCVSNFFGQSWRDRWPARAGIFRGPHPPHSKEVCHRRGCQAP
jgi:hypothetical protein